MPDSITLLAYAKLNLSLDITGTRPDGYHTLSTVMQSIDICDTVTVERTDDSDNGDLNYINVVSNDDIPCDEHNTVYKAAEQFFRYNEIVGRSVKIKVKKNIPVAAGLGGGSADAAAVIYGMNEIFHTALNNDELCEIGANVGMDVPFCILGGTQLAEGMGVILTPLPPIENCSFVLIKDDAKSSTADMYRKYDALVEVDHPDTAAIVDDICEGETFRAAEMFKNVFSPLWGEKYQKIRAALLDCGAVNAVLSGSGPTVFGIFDDEDDARRCKSMLESSFDEVILCSPVNLGIEEK